MKRKIFLRIIYLISMMGLVAVPFFKYIQAQTTVTSTSNVVVTVFVLGPQVCGDSIIQPPEECDDGNLINNDGCDDQCFNEVPECGNGIIETGEECDDGNLVNFDGCDSLCNIENINPGGRTWEPDKNQSIADFFGRTSPYAFITLKDGDNIAGTTQADEDGLFNFRLSSLTTGVHKFSLYGEDRYSRDTLTINFSVSLVERTITKIENIFLPPTISIVRNKVIKGQSVTVFGETYPNSNIILYLPNDSANFSTTATNDGYWQTNITTLYLDVGSFSVKAKSAANDGLASNFSENLYFEILPSPLPGICSGPDLNFDGLIDVYDFSILLSSWQENNPANICVDINRDGIVNILDFSILLSWWSKPL